MLAEGLTGPEFFKRFDFDPTVGLCEHRFLDMDYDNDIDLADVARFQNAFTGKR